MKKKLRKGFIGILGVLIVIGLIFCVRNIWLQQEEEKESLILSIEGTGFTLSDLMYDIWNMEMKVNKMALAYDYENPNKFWNTYTNGRFTRLKAKDLVVENVIRDEVLYQEALKLELSLDEEEKEIVMERAQELDFSITDYQREITELTLEDFQKIVEKQALGEKYEDYISEVIGLSQEDMQVEGEYYEELKGNYQVEIREEEWEKIEMGKVTLQLEE